MIVYYDIMLLEDQSLINLRHSERFRILSNLICCRKGWAELVPRQVVDFGQPLGASTLRKAFAVTILARKEGLVLKPDEPYFDFKNERRKFSSCCIKLKKEYIGNFGDVGDFAVIGAKYDSTKAMAYRIPGLKWTHFYVGCLDNREAVRSWKAKPEFTIVNVVELNETLLKEVVAYSNPEPIDPRQNEALIFKQAPGVEQGSPPTVIFTKPLVFDLKCFSFDRVGNTGFWSLRFPSVTKVHFDRDFTDTISFEQLQTLARDATTASELEDSQENLQWIAKLEAADPRGIAVDTASQLTVTTVPTPSPRKSTQNTTSTRSPTSPLAERSPAGNQLGHCHERFERLRPLPLSTAAATTSVPSAPSISHTEPRAKQKRDPPLSHPASPRKRLKADTESLSQYQQSPTDANISQPREPLGHISENSRSQRTMSHYTLCCPSPPTHACSSPSTPAHESRSREHGLGEDLFMHDLVTEQAPWTLRDFEGDLENELETETEPRREEPVIWKDIALDEKECSDESEDLEQDSESDPEKDTEKELETETEPRRKRTAIWKDVAIGEEGCAYAHENCVFAKAEVLISPGLLSNPQAKTLFGLHGIGNPVEKIDAWLKGQLEEREGVTKTYLLCQSNHKEETKSLLQKIQNARETIPLEQGDWIHVYDWRVLGHVTIMEDVSIKPKNYDGFSDPWQRWRIGLGLI